MMEKCNIHVLGMVRLILNLKSLGNRGNVDKMHNHNYEHLYYKTEKNKKVKRYSSYSPACEQEVMA